ncbi:MAG: UbiD family decarboxylase [Desulfobacteraceae bacterium]|nr:MAG: UbiD family decarboxylase [Desulfobacteraceae bacterium]
MHADLRSFLRDLERRGELVRVRTEVDPNQEITVIQHRVIAAGGPALLFERVKGSAFRVVSNLFGTPRRVAMACGAPPAELGQQLARIGHHLMPPSLKGLWRARRDLRRLSAARMRTVRRGPILEHSIEPPDLMKLPVLTCWPEDGGPFFTLPLVHTTDPYTGQGNLGIYRMQRFDAASTGMHWQIEKGGGFHFHTAARSGRPLSVSVILGGPPALTLAAVAPLPEGVDERLLAAYLTGRPLDVIRRTVTGHRIPAAAEFVLEGQVFPGDRRMEGPFGDHFGHYSAAAEYPVLRVQRILARAGAIYPATVVGKPVQEDYYIGEALQEITLPLLRMIKPAVMDLWAYPETGFHPLAVLSVRQRYPQEALKFTLGLLGEGQLSLTKVMIAVDPEVNVRDFRAVSAALWRHLPVEGVHLLAPTAQDTLDFTGPAMNTGSRLILLATRTAAGTLRKTAPPEPPAAGELHPGVRAAGACGPAFLVVQVKDGFSDFTSLCETLRHHETAGRYLFHVVVSADVPVDDPMLLLWGWFTRFDPASDLHPAGRRIQGNRLLLDFPIAIDARWKKGYPRPVAFDPAVARRVDEKWKSYGIPNKTSI